MKTHSIIINRQNGGQIDIGCNKKITKLAITQMHIDGKDLEKSDYLHILFVGYESGILHLNRNKLEYTKMINLDETPVVWEKDFNDKIWDWEGEPSNFNKLNVLIYADRKLVKNVDICMELTVEFEHI